MAYATTVRLAFASLHSRLLGLVGASPTGPAALRAVVKGQGAPSHDPLPFLALQILSSKRVNWLDGGAIHETLVKVRVVFNVSTARDPTDDALAYAAQVDNRLEGWVPPDGTEGGENTNWSLTVPDMVDPGTLAFVESTLTFRTVSVRGVN